MADDRLLGHLGGEARNQGYRGRLAVANVLANRAAQDFRGYGTSLAHQATKGTGIFRGNSEFNGFLMPPASLVPQLSSALANSGNDITGGTLFFANPSGSSADWAGNLNEGNSLKIGDHLFTDNTNGVPFSGSGDQHDADVAQDAFQDRNDLDASSEPVQSPLAPPDQSGNSIRQMTPEEAAQMQGAEPSPALLDQQGKEPVLGPRDAEGLQGHRNKILNDLWAKVIENVDFVAFAERPLSK